MSEVEFDRDEWITASIVQEDGSSVMRTFHIACWLGRDLHPHCPGMIPGKTCECVHHEMEADLMEAEIDEAMEHYQAWGSIG